MKLLLKPLSLTFNCFTWIRNQLYDRNFFSIHRFDVPIISVGNITMGGSGKTPMVIAIAKYCIEKGKSPAIVSRGYGRNSKGLYIVHDEKNTLVSHSEGGDEPFMIAQNLRNVPIVVCEKRVKAIKKVMELSKTDIIIMDDAFQHRSVHRNIDIVLINTSQTEELKDLFPLGKLRESLRGIKRSDVIVFTKGDEEQTQALEQRLKAYAPQALMLKSLFESSCMKYEQGTYSKTKPNEPLIAFSGVGDPKSFKVAVANENITPQILYEFRDHQRYSEKIIRFLLETMKKYNCDAILTTEKDLVKLPKDFLEKHTIFIIKIEIKLNDKSMRILKNRIADLFNQDR